MVATYIPSRGSQGSTTSFQRGTVGYHLNSVQEELVRQATCVGQCTGNFVPSLQSLTTVFYVPAASTVPEQKPGQRAENLVPSYLSANQVYSLEYLYRLFLGIFVPHMCLKPRPSPSSVMQVPQVLKVVFEDTCRGFVTHQAHMTVTDHKASATRMKYISIMNWETPVAGYVRLLRKPVSTYMCLWSVRAFMERPRVVIRNGIKWAQDEDGTTGHHHMHTRWYHRGPECT
jgi:hypothetical protein